MDTPVVTEAVSPLLCTIIAVVAFIAGGLITYFIYRALLKKKRVNMIKEAEMEAEVIKKEKILQAKEKFYQLKSEHEKLINEKNNKISQTENKIKQREASISQKIAEIQKERLKSMQ
jgi:ribonucrease Y